MSILADRLNTFVLACKAKFAALTASLASLQALVAGIPSPVTPEQFGAVGDGVTDDSAAFAAMKAHLDTLAGGNIDYGSAIPSFRLGFKKYRMGTAKLSFTYAVQIYGESGGEFGGEGTALIWDAGHADHGLEFTGPNWWIDGVAIEGPFAHTGPSTEAERHGINATARGGWGKAWVRGWAGDGVHIEASVANGTNANGCRGFSLTTNNNRNGLRLKGTDVNAGRFSYIDANGNNQTGVLDEGAFGNGYGTIQTADNGVTGLGVLCMSFNNGHVFTVADGQATGASTNSPPSTATSNTWWIYCYDLGAATDYAPQWFSGQTWRCGGAIYIPMDSTSNASTVDYLYSENDQAVVQTGPNVLIGGGLYGPAPNTRFVKASSVHGSVDIGPGLHVSGGNFVHDVNNNTGHVLDGTVAGSDVSIVLNNGNFSGFVTFQYNGVQYGSIFASRSLGFFQDINTGLGHHFRVNGSDRAIVDVNGITVPEIASASVATPAASTQTLFIDTADHKLKRKDSSGTVTIIA